jgi:ribosome-binding protein aMBF1 (putative translation factor)
MGDDVLTMDNKIAVATDGGAAKRSSAGAPDSGVERDEIAVDLTGAADDESADSFSFGRRLRRARLAKQWSQLQLAHRMREVGAAHRGAATIASLMLMLSRWENDRKHPNQYNLHLLAASLDVPVFELGLPVDRDFVF